jgi:hypothetical protein
MSEIDALLRLYGALDRAVATGEVHSSDLAPLLNAYRDGKATGWYEKKHLPWVEEVKERAHSHVERPTQPIRRLRAEVTRDDHADEISAALSSFPDEHLKSRAAARRLLAVTMAARSMPEVFGPGGARAEHVSQALVFRRPGEEDGLAVQRAARLHEMFAAEFTSMSAWQGVVEQAVVDGLLPESFRGQSSAPPCTGRLIMRSDATGEDSDPCTVMEAEFTTSDVSFEELKCYLEPQNWQFPGSFWCRMERAESLGPNSWRYHETVSTDCGSPGAWSVSTDLQFWFSHPTATEARVEYDFPPGLPTPSSDITVDEGSLRVIQLPDGSVNVKTTKRVRFAGSFDGAGLAMFMCATGYSTILEDLVFSITADPLNPLKPFPVPSPEGGVVSPPNNTKKPAPTSKASGSKPAPDPKPESLNDIVSEAADHVASYVKDVSETCAASLKAVEAGTYKAEHAWADGMKLWSTYLTGVSKALDLGVRTAKAYTKKPTDET